MKSVLALSLTPLGAGWAFGIPGDRPMSGFMAFGANTHTDDELFARAQFEMLSSINFHAPQIVAVTAVADDARHARRLYDYQVIARALVKAKLPGAAKLVDIGNALECFTGTERHATKADADRAMKMESRRRLWLSMDDIESDRCAALAVWCYAASMQLPELAFHQPRKARA